MDMPASPRFSVLGRGLRIEDFAVSGPTAIDDLRLSEDRGEKLSEDRGEKRKKKRKPSYSQWSGILDYSAIVDGCWS